MQTVQERRIFSRGHDRHYYHIIITELYNNVSDRLPELFIMIINIILVYLKYYLHRNTRKAGCRSFMQCYMHGACAEHFPSQDQERWWSQSVLWKSFKGTRSRVQRSRWDCATTTNTETYSIQLLKIAVSEWAGSVCLEANHGEEKEK